MEKISQLIMVFIIATLICTALLSVMLTGCMDRQGENNVPGDSVPSDGVTASAETMPEIDGIPKEEVEMMRGAGLTVNSAYDIRYFTDENDNRNNRRFSRCYGVYHGYIVLFSGTPLDAIGLIEVAGYEFRYHNEFRIYVFRDGEFIRIENAYEEGFLNEEDIAAIHERHVQAENEAEAYRQELFQQHE